MKLDFEKLDRLAAAGMTAQAMIEMLRIEDERERAPLTVVEFPPRLPEQFPNDYRHRLFNEGLRALARITGKGPDACRSFMGKCLKAAGDDAVTVLGLIEDAERNQAVNPSAWIMARLKSQECLQHGKAQRPGGSLIAAIDAALEQSQDTDLAAPTDLVLCLQGGSIR